MPRSRVYSCSISGWDSSELHKVIASRGLLSHRQSIKVPLIWSLHKDLNRGLMRTKSPQYQSRLNPGNAIFWPGESYQKSEIRKPARKERVPGCLDEARDSTSLYACCESTIGAWSSFCVAHYAAARLHSSLETKNASLISTSSTLLHSTVSSWWLLVFAWLAQSTPYRNHGVPAFGITDVGSLAKEGLSLG